MQEVSARIVDLEGGTTELPINQLGEIVIKDISIMRGYWNMLEETAIVLRDGWFYTCDIGRMDEDGFFFIEDRKKAMIIAEGYNIYPRGFEDVLIRHAAVMEVAVGSVPDHKRGETVKDWIVRTPGVPLMKKRSSTGASSS